MKFHRIPDKEVNTCMTKNVSILQKMFKRWEKICLKNFQTHICNFLFGDSVLNLNYKYIEVSPSAKTFTNSHSSSRCRSKESLPPIRYRIGGGDSTKLSFERDLSQNEEGKEDK